MGACVRPLSAQGSAIALPEDLNFGEVRVNATSSLSFAVYNQGSDTVGVAIATVSTAYTVASAPDTLLPGQSDSVSVLFAPVSAGDFDGTVTVTGSDGSAPAVSLSGTGVTPPEISADTLFLDFGTITVGDRLTKNITINNLGTSTVDPLRVLTYAFAPFELSSQFGIVGLDGSYSIPGLGSRVLEVTYAPTEAGTHAGRVNINHLSEAGSFFNDFMPVEIVAVAVLAPSLGDNLPDPGLLTFDSVELGSSDVMLGAVTYGNDRTIIEELWTTSDQFTVSADDPGLLGNTSSAGNEFRFTVTYTPIQRGSHSAQLLIRSNDPNEIIRTWNLAGEAHAPAMLVNATPLDFGDVRLSEAGTPQFISVSNVSDTGADLIVSVSSSSEEFITPTQQLSIPAGDSQSVVVNFVPTARGTRTGILTFAAINDPDNPVTTVDLTGIGRLAQLVTSEIPGEIAFAQTAVHGPGEAQSFALRNSSAFGNLQVSLSVEPEQFAVVGSPQFTIDPDGTHVVDLLFVPTSQGVTSGLLSITALNGVDTTSATVGLTGIGLNPQIRIGLETSDYTLRFGRVRRIVGSSELQVALRNTGSATAQVFNVTTDNATFDAIPPADRAFASGDSVSMGVVFAPQSTGLHEGVLTITGDFGQPSAVDTIVVFLSGEGTSPEISVTPEDVDFEPESLNNPSLPRYLYVRNVGDEDLQITWNASSSSSVFAFAGAANTLSPGESARIDVIFTPTVTAPVTQSLVVASNDPASPSVTVQLSGSGRDTEIAVEGVNFGDVLVGEPAPGLSAVITNEGSEAVEVTVLGLAVGGFEVANSVLTINGGASQGIGVEFTPSRVGPASAILQVRDETGQIHSIPIEGAGVVPEISIASASAFQFPVRVSEADTIAIPIRNVGSFELAISGILLVDESGSTEPTFRLITSPPLTVARSGGIDTIYVEFRPRDLGRFGATLTVEHNDPAQGPVVAAISGVGKGHVMDPISTVDFGDVRNAGLAGPGSTPTIDVPIVNSGTDTLFVTATSVDDPEQYTVPSLNAAIPPDGGERILSVTFHPTRSGQLPATVSIETARPTATETFVVRGTGIRPKVSPTPRLVLFDTTTVNLPDAENPKADQAQLIIKNEGDHVLTITDLAIDDADQFQILGTEIGGVAVSRPWTLVPDGLLDVSLQFKPVRADLQSIVETVIPFPARLTVFSDDADSTAKVVDLFGVGVVSSVRALADTVDFGRESVGTSGRRGLRLQNDGDEATMEATLADTQFSVVGGTTITVPTGTHEIQLAFSPVSRNGNKTIASDIRFTDLGTGRNFRVDLIGEGVQGALQVQPNLIQFGNVRVAAPSQQTITVTNVGNADLDVEISVQADDPDDATHYRPEIEAVTIAGGSTEVVVPVTFTPKQRTSAGDPFLARLRVRGSDALTGAQLSETEVSMTGVGVAPEVSLQAADFGPVTFRGGDSSQLRIQNIGTDALTVRGIEVVNAAFRHLFTFDATSFEVEPNTTRAVNITLRADDPALLDSTSLAVSVFHESPEQSEVTTVTRMTMSFEVKDQTVPEISFSSSAQSLSGPSTAVENEALEFTVYFEDDSGRIDVAATNLRSRRVGSSGDYETDRFTLTPQSDGFLGTVRLTPEDASRGLEYYIETADAGGNKVILDRTGPVTDMAGLVSPFPLRVAVRELAGAEIEQVNKTYHMVSVPLDLQVGDVFRVLARTLTGEDIRMGKANAPKWRVFREGGEELNPKTSSAEFTPGQAFWVVVKDRPITMRAGAGTSTAAIPAWDTTLVNSGWHMIGHPYNFPVAWENIEVNGEVVSSGSAARFWEYGSEFGLGKADWGIDPQGLRPWHGYAVYTTGRNSDLTIHPRATTRSTKAASRRLSQKNGWTARIALTSQNAVDGLNLLGMAMDASAGWDIHDNVEPPAVGGYVKAYFAPLEMTEHPANRLSADIRPVTEGASWQLHAESNLPGELLKLTLQDVENVPASMEVALFDLYRGTTFDLRGVEGYSFRAPREQSFRLIIGSGDYVRTTIQSLTPPNAGLGAAYPNPFNAEIGITFGIATRDLVQVEIYNVVGQRVRTLINGEVTPGYHRVIWDGYDRGGRAAASGAYLVRMVTSETTQARKILLVR